MYCIFSSIFLQITSHCEFDVSVWYNFKNLECKNGILDEDEDCVLNNLNQVIFDQLIDDTLQAVKDVQNQRACLL